MMIWGLEMFHPIWVASLVAHAATHSGGELVWGRDYRLRKSTGELSEHSKHCDFSLKLILHFLRLIDTVPLTPTMNRRPFVILIVWFSRAINSRIPAVRFNLTISIRPLSTAH